VQHEHVVELDWLTRLLWANSDAVAVALWNMPAALVTKEEAKLLPNGHRWDGLWGWDRYRAAELSLIDAESLRPVDLQAMSAELRAVYAPIVEQAAAADASL